MARSAARRAIRRAASPIDNGGEGGDGAGESDGDGGDADGGVGGGEERAGGGKGEGGEADGGSEGDDDGDGAGEAEGAGGGETEGGKPVVKQLMVTSSIAMSPCQLLPRIPRNITPAEFTLTDA